MTWKKAAETKITLYKTKHWTYDMNTWSAVEVGVGVISRAVGCLYTAWTRVSTHWKLESPLSNNNSSFCEILHWSGVCVKVKRDVRHISRERDIRKERPQHEQNYHHQLEKMAHSSIIWSLLHARVCVYARACVRVKTEKLNTTVYTEYTQGKTNMRRIAINSKEKAHHQLITIALANTEARSIRSIQL